MYNCLKNIEYMVKYIVSIPLRRNSHGRSNEGKFIRCFGERN